MAAGNLNLASLGTASVSKTRPMPGPVECRTCRHYQPGSPTAAAGTCRIKAPVVLATDGSAYWPRVAQYEWCGDHARRSVPAEG